MENNGEAVEHIAVLAKTLAEQVSLPSDGIMVDATIGQGGHSLLFGQTLTANGLLVGLDVDERSIAQAKEKLKDTDCEVILIRSNFSQVARQIYDLEIEKVDFILADLGVCSAQLADNEMGLSFQTDMPLDMRLDRSLKTTAADIVNRTDEKSLADLIFKYGQDRASRRIARFIAQHRRTKPIKTTGQLASIVCKALFRPGRKRWTKIHPATRTFQALRIAVNDELQSLQKLLDSAPALLKENGYIAIISFHSLEDRIVKLDFRHNKKEGIYNVITKKPIVPDKDEIAQNPRARSAKLRIAQKI
jgi:16S rRNA (cytosine1402-N4)-methyltransferase